MVKGEIIDSCVWAQHGALILITTSDQRYLDQVNQKTKGPVKLDAGKYYSNPGNMLSVFRFEGIFHHTYLDIDHWITKYVEEHDRSYGYNYRSMIKILEYETEVKIRMNSGKSPSYLYTEFSLNEDGYITNKVVQCRKSHIKNLVEYTGELRDDVLDFKVDLGQWANLSSTYGRSINDDYIRMNTHAYVQYSNFFKDKAEAKAFDYSAIIENIRPDYPSRIKFKENAKPTNYRYNNTQIISDNVKRTVTIKDER